MNVKEIMGMVVLDSDVQELGKVKDVEFDEATFKLSNLIVSANNNILSNEETKISIDNVERIGAYILTNISSKKVENVDVIEE